MFSIENAKYEVGGPYAVAEERTQRRKMHPDLER